jgi:catechol 2,3-dioxygenase-like lactoylglutathione lyase family enzyme
LGLLFSDARRARAARSRRGAGYSRRSSGLKTHLSLPTRDIAAGVAFYETLLAAPPAKHYDDYALFVSANPPLELVLELDPLAAAPAHEHYGIAADDAAEVERAIARLEAAGYPIDVERGETCCYAVQTKVWASDPEGRRWETYFVIEDVEARDDAAPACC